MICYVVIVILILNQFEPAHFLLEWAIFAENSMSEETKKVFHPLRLKKKRDIYTKNIYFVSIKAKLIIFTSAFITTCLGSAAVYEQEAWKRLKKDWKGRKEQNTSGFPYYWSQKIF